MKVFILSLALFGASLLHPADLRAQRINLANSRLLPNRVALSFARVAGKGAICVVKDSTVQDADEPTFVRIEGINFTNGTIEVKVLSRLLKNASASARGFIGVAFRIDAKNTKYESIYIRPTNGRATDQVRRNHAIQYYSYPDYKFDRLRNEAPERYESYADMGLNEWITMRIVVSGQTAKLFLNDANQPSLLVNDLKHGPNASGGIGLWVESGTEGYFRDLRVYD